VLGPGAIDRVEGGHTSGSAASLEVVAEARKSTSVDYPSAARGAQIGDRYVASVWVRSEHADLPVALSVVSRSGGRQQASQVIEHTRSGARWVKISVGHVVGLPNAEVGLRLTATQLRPDRAIVIDEATLRRG
jgi:hypothetical protein